MNEEQLIQAQFGKENAFRVPEGYFETFVGSVMEKIPTNDAKVVELPQRKQWRTAVRVAAAACFAALLFGVGYSWFASNDDARSNAVTAVYETDDASFDDMADYAMIDVGDMYCYVADNN